MPLPGARATLEAVAALRDADRPAGRPARAWSRTSSSPTSRRRSRRSASSTSRSSDRSGSGTCSSRSRSTSRCPPRSARSSRTRRCSGPRWPRPGRRFADTIFITENRGHVLAARRLGLTAVHFQGPGQTSGDVATLPELVPIIRDFALAGTTGRAVLAVTPESAATVQQAVTAAGASWTRLGDELVVTGGADAVAEAVAAGRRRPTSPGPPARPASCGWCCRTARCSSGSTRTSRCSPAAAGTWSSAGIRPGHAVPHGHDVPCCAVRPLPADTTVVAPLVLPTARARRASPAWVRDCVDRVSAETFDADLHALVALPTRLSTRPEFGSAVELVRDRLDELGYHDVDPADPGRQRDQPERDRRAGRQRAGAAASWSLVTAHLDSINIAGGPAAPAPGRRRQRLRQRRAARHRRGPRRAPAAAARPAADPVRRRGAGPVRQPPARRAAAGRGAGPDRARCSTWT